MYTLSHPTKSHRWTFRLRRLSEYFPASVGLTLPLVEETTSCSGDAGSVTGNRWVLPRSEACLILSMERRAAEVRGERVAKPFRLRSTTALLLVGDFTSSVTSLLLSSRLSCLTLRSTGSICTVAVDDDDDEEDDDDDDDEAEEEVVLCVGVALFRFEAPEAAATAGDGFTMGVIVTDDDISTPATPGLRHNRDGEEEVIGRSSMFIVPFRFAPRS